MNVKTILFMGASTGVGLSALKHALAAGHHCIALCRTPSKMTGIVSNESNSNLSIVEGNAHDVNAVSKYIKKQNGAFVDEIISTVGAKPVLSMNVVDDPDVCKKAMATLLEAISNLRKEGITGKPLIIICSTTGISKFGRDVPLLMMPLYHVLLRVPHQDKDIMEQSLTTSGEDFVLIRPSLLTNGASEKTIRIGIEDPARGRESNAIGYTISREDTGRWIAQHLIINTETQYINKIVTITY